jgi:hypothetical protein
MNPTKEERQRWWLLCYAVTSMEKAIDTCDLLIQQCSDNRSKLFQPLSLAVHAYYTRPFKRSKCVGSLPHDLVPASSMGIHRWLEHFRDGVLAHTDADHKQEAGRPMHDVVYSVRGTVFSTADPRALITAYRDAKGHCIAMRKVFFVELMKFHESFDNLMPSSDGDFLLNLDTTQPLFTSYGVPPS